MAKWPLNTGWPPNRGCKKNISNKSVLKEGRKSVVAPWVLHFLKLYEQVIDIVWPFNTGQDNRNSSLGLSKGWPRPLNRGDRLIEVKIKVNRENNFLDFDNWPLNRGWLLNTGPLNTGLTVIKWPWCHSRQMSHRGNRQEIEWSISICIYDFAYNIAKQVVSK